MRYQAILFDLDGTLLPMHEPTFVKSFYSALLKYVTPNGISPKEVGEVLQGSLAHVIANDGSCLNRKAFENYYDQYYEKTGIRINIEDMERFYATAFDCEVKDSCGYDPAAARVIEYIKQTGTPIVVATNPFFPRIATQIRLKWAGLDHRDFCDITVYENSHYCKPNLMYYRELFDRTAFDPVQCLMVGNNVAEDMIARDLGCDVYLIQRNLINPNNVDIEQFKHGDLDSLIEYLDQCK